VLLPFELEVQAGLQQRRAAPEEQVLQALAELFGAPPSSQPGWLARLREEGRSVKPLLPRRALLKRILSVSQIFSLAL
jgi:hypothetical protein